MQNTVINMCEKFHYNRLRNDRALGDRKSDNNKNKNNVRSHWGPVSGYRRVDEARDVLVGTAACGNVAAELINSRINLACQLQHIHANYSSTPLSFISCQLLDQCSNCEKKQLGGGVECRIGGRIETHGGMWCQEGTLVDLTVGGGSAPPPNF